MSFLLARMYKSWKCYSFEKVEARMIPFRCGTDYTMESVRGCASSRQALHQPEGLPGAGEAENMEKNDKVLFLFKLIKNTSQCADRKHGSLRKFGSSALVSFV